MPVNRYWVDRCLSTQRYEDGHGFEFMKDGNESSDMKMEMGLCLEKL